MPVYLIRAGETGPCKIGKADDPKGRCCELQVAHYEKLTVLRTWEGAEAEETALHLRFADLHIRGEWFAFSRLMLGDVGLVEIREEVAVFEIPSTNTAEIIVTKLGGTRQAARFLNLSTSTVQSWKAVGHIPAQHQKTILMLSRTAKLAITPEDFFSATLSTVHTTSAAPSDPQAAA